MKPAIGFDMGGTSTDVSLFHISHEHIFETEIAETSIQNPNKDGEEMPELGTSTSK